MLSTLNSQLKTSISRGVQTEKTASYRVASLLCIYLILNTHYKHSKSLLTIRILQAIKMWGRLQALRITKSSRLRFKEKLWFQTLMKRLRSSKDLTMITSHRTSITNREKMSIGINNKPKIRVLQPLNLQVKGREEWF